MNSHLSSEQLDCALNGQPSEEVTRHLGSCAQCERELDSLREVFSNFRTSATAAAVHHRRFVATAGTRRVPRMAWALAVAVLFVSVGAPLVVHHRGTTAGNGMAVQAPATMSDEALLNSVQDDLSSSVPESLQPLAGTSTQSASTTNARNKN